MKNSKTTKIWPYDQSISKNILPCAKLWSYIHVILIWTWSDCILWLCIGEKNISISINNNDLPSIFTSAINFVKIQIQNMWNL